MENKLNDFRNLRNDFIEEQERVLSYKSASEGMGLKEDVNTSDHILRGRNKRISKLNDLIWDIDEKRFSKLTAPPKELYYTNPKNGQTFVDETFAKKDRSKALWFGLGLGFTAGIILAACSKKKGGE